MQIKIGKNYLRKNIMKTNKKDEMKSIKVVSKIVSLFSYNNLLQIKKEI
jgi:hypothetical protein